MVFALNKHMKYYFKDLPEKRKKSISDWALMMHILDPKVKDPVKEQKKTMKWLESKEFDTPKKLKSWIWWKIGEKAERRKLKVLNNSKFI